MTNTANTHTQPTLIDIPARTVVAIDGEGSPEGPDFQAAIAALDESPNDDVPLEGTYWSGDDPLRFDLDRPDEWRWTLRVPTDTAPNPAREGIRVEHRPAERVASLIHHGPYEAEEPSLAALYVFIAASGLRPAGPHTEVYLNDPRVVAPADLRTELRVPVQ